MKVENKVEPRYTFSINLPTSLYQKLLNEAGRGKVSTFIREMLEERLAESEDKLVSEYRECYTNNPHLLEEAKQWEKAEIESWLNYERNKNKPTTVKWSKKLTNGRKVN